MSFFKAILIIVITLFFLSCGDYIIQSNETENKDQLGKIMLEMDLTKAPIEVAKIDGFLARTNFDTLFFQFEIYNDTATARVENIATGIWHLQVNAYITEDIISYSGSQIVNIVPGVVTPVRLHLNPVTGGLEIKVTWGAEYIYFEGFESSMYFGSYKLVHGNSYIKEGRDGWKAYAEAFYEGREVAASWDWVQQDNPQNLSKSIRGITTINEMGCLWLFKSIPVNKNEKLIATVDARTKKIHNGSDTGPDLYVFDGKIDFPSSNLNSLIEKDKFIWGSPEWSSWQNLEVTIYPSQDHITVGLRVGDAWNSYTIYHEFDSLYLYYPN